MEVTESEIAAEEEGVAITHHMREKQGLPPMFVVLHGAEKCPWAVHSAQQGGV